MINIQNKSEVYYIINVEKSNIIKILQGKKELIQWLSRYQELEKGFKGYNNIYLDSINVTGKDTESYTIYKNNYFQTIEGLRPYMVIDGYNRVLDVRVYYKQIVEESKRLSTKPRYYCRKDWYILAMKKEVGEGYKGAKFRQEPIPYIRKRRNFNCCRRIRTTNERRQSVDLEIQSYIRASRNVNNLPNCWDEIIRNVEKSWKSQYKCKKQWMKNQKN